MAEQDFQKLLDLITKTEAQIGKLEGRITQLQSKLASGDFGVGRVGELNRQIEKLLATLSTKQATRIQLINERDLIETGKQLDKIARSIETVTANLDQLKRERASSLALQPHGGTNVYNQDLDRQIRNQERALALNRARFEKLYQSLSPEQLSGLSTNAPQAARDALRDISRRQVEATLNEIQNQLLQGAIDARLQAAAAKARVPFGGKGISAYVPPYDPSYDVPLPKDRRVPFGADLEPEGPVTTIPGGAGSTVVDAQRRYADALNQRVAELRAERFSDLREDFTRGIANEPTPNILTRAQQRAQEEQAALDSTRNKIRTEKRYVTVLEAAARQGFTLDDLAFARSKGTAGIEEFRFRRRDPYGVTQQLDLFNTPAGRTTAGISNQFRTFGQGVVRDIGELTKWSIALAVIYGPLRKLQELTQTMIDNQTRLAEATISVSSAFLGQNQIFNIAADQANRAGEEISGVIDAFTQAYRATGGTGNQVERLATAQGLLSDALILSKLSTLDQAQAIDTLAAAVRQTGGNFEITTELLDSWVRVTKVANVDLATLSTGFAVLGDAADAAGFSMDELNGLIALIAESSQSSGQEVANAARAIVGGLQSDQGIRALENLGIATKTTTGELRSLEDILLEVSSLIDKGIISPTQLAGLGQDIGGGVRRGAIVTTVLSNYGRAQEVAAESARANGDAQAALDKQLQTVQTSLSRLQNSFEELAQTLGTEGGFLGIISGGVDLVTSLVKAFDGLTSILGKATPALAAFIATSLILKQRGQGGIQQALLGIGERAGSVDPTLASLYKATGNTPTSVRFGQSFRENVVGTNVTSGIFQGLATAFIPALLNATNKEDRFGGFKAASNAVGGLAGGIIGSLVAGSPVIGAAIGVAISEAFVNATLADKNIFGYTAPTLGEPGAPTNTPDDLDAALQQAEINLYKSIGFGNEAFGRFITSGAEKTASQLIDRINEAIKNQDRGQLDLLTGPGRYGQQNRQFLQSIGITPDIINQAFRENRQIELSPQYAAFTRASREAQEQFRAAEAARLARGDVPDVDTAFTRLVQANKDSFRDLVSTLKETSREQLSRERATGVVRGAEYGRRTEALGGFDVRALQYYTALGNQVDQITGGTEDAQRAFEILNNVIVFGAEDSLTQLTSLTGEITELINLLADPKLNEDTIAKMFPEEGIAGATAKLKELQGVLADLISDANQQVLLGRIQVPDLQGDINKPLTTQELSLVKSQAQSLQDQFYQGFLKIPDDMYNALQESWKEWAQIVEESGQVFFETVSGIDPQFFQQAMAQLLEQGKLQSQQASPFGIQQVDLPSSRLGELQSMVDYFTSYLAQNFPQYQQNPEDIGIIFSDYVTAVLHGDNLAIKLALEKLVDLNQKQLDGQYNIPEGATIWVPLTAAYYRPQSQGAGGLPTVDSQAVNTNTNATEENTNALRELSFAFKGDLGYSRAAEERKLTEQRAAADAYKGDLGESRRAEELRQLATAFRGDLGYGRTSTQPERLTGGTPTFLNTGLAQLLDEVRNFIRGLFTQRSPYPGYGGAAAGGGVGGEAGVGRGTGSFAAAQPAAPTVNARMDLRIENSTQLLVDGRVLASIITPYLSADLFKLDAAQGTVTRRYVI